MQPRKRQCPKPSGGDEAGDAAAAGPSSLAQSTLGDVLGLMLAAARPPVDCHELYMKWHLRLACHLGCDAVDAAIDTLKLPALQVCRAAGSCGRRAALGHCCAAGVPGGGGREERRLGPGRRRLT
jgi:hypothetical protein